MLQKVSQDCWNISREKGKILIDPPKIVSLPILSELIKDLHQEELSLREALRSMNEVVKQDFLTPDMTTSDFHGEYKPFFDTLPQKKPNTERSFALFERERLKDPNDKLLDHHAIELYKEYIPDWIIAYVKKI